MSLQDFELNIKEYSNYDFSDEQLKVFRSDITEIYSILKNVFDRKRKDRPYTTVAMYKFKREQRFQRPDEFYHFQSDNVEIHIARRKGNKYSVAVTGFSPDNYTSLKYNLDSIEKKFSSGFDYYGLYDVSAFNEVICLFHNIIKSYIFTLSVY